MKEALCESPETIAGSWHSVAGQSSDRDECEGAVGTPLKGSVVAILGILTARHQQRCVTPGRTGTPQATADAEFADVAF